MSRTRRWVQPGWGLEDETFREYFPGIKSDKHQCRDRPSRQAKRRHRKMFKHSPGRERHDLLREAERRDLQDALE